MTTPPLTSVDRTAPAAANLPAPLAWIGLCAAAETVGMTAAAAAAKAGSSPGIPILAGLTLVVAGGLVEGVALGVAQAVGLRRLLDRPARRRWVFATIAVAGLGWAAASAPAVLASGDGGSEPPLALLLAGAAGLGAAMGTALGAAQATALRERAAHRRRWVAASAVAWTPAMVVIFLGATAPSADWSVAAVVALGAATGLVAGSVLGAVSGWFLPSLSGLAPRDRVVLAVPRSPAHRVAGRALVGLRLRGRRSARRHRG